MTHTQHRQHTEAGFTLVELSIVLVIIGLIVGGVLAGQDMIKAAEIRATVSQTEKYNTAVNTFKDKYRAIPGDIGESAATSFGMNSAVGRATAATGGTDQDGLVECNNGAACVDVRYFGSETALFWNDLSWSLLISESLQTADGTINGGGGAIVPGGATLTTNMSNYLPEAKIGKGNYFTIFSASGKNFYQLAGITGIAAGVYTLEARLTPQEAFNIDAKMDDGKPQTGGVRAVNVDDAAAAAAVSLNNNVATIATGVAPEASGTAGTCVEDGTAPADGIADYDTVTTDEANAPACMIRMMFN